MKGLSLIEIVISMALLTGVGLGVMQLSSNSSRSIKGNERSVEMIAFLSEVRGLLSDIDACTNSLGGLNAEDSGNIDFQLRNSNDEIVFSKGDTYGSSGLRIQSFKLTDERADVEAIADSESTTNLEIRFDRKNSGGTNYDISKSIRLSIVTNAANAIDSCHAYSKEIDLIWSRLDADPDQIYYAGGKVTIGGAPDPSQVVDLDVQGSIKVGQGTNPVCTSASMAGAIRYNPSTDKMEYCSASDVWSPMGDTPEPTPRSWSLLTDNTVSTYNGTNNSGGETYIAALGYPSTKGNCRIVINVNGGWKAGVTNNNPTNTKSCFAFSVVPDGQAFSVQSDPWSATARIKVYIFQ